MCLCGEIRKYQLFFVKKSALSGKEKLFLIIWKKHCHNHLELCRMDVQAELNCSHVGFCYSSE